jgi:chromosome segregation ATPase
LATFYEDFKTSKKLLESVKKAWKHPGRVTSAKRVEGKKTEGYPIWQKKRGKGYKVPPFEGPPRSLIQSAEDIHEEVRAQQESYNLSLNAEVEELGAKKRKLESNLATREKALVIIKQENDDLSAQLQHQQLDFQQLQEKYVLLSEDKTKQDVNMKRWVRRASKAEEMVLKLEETNKSLQEQHQKQDVIIANLDEHLDHLLFIEQTLSSEKEKAEKEAECWASEAMRYHVQADDAKNYALGLRGLAQQIADGEPMTRNEFHQFFGLIRDGINEISAYDGPRLWKD